MTTKVITASATREQRALPLPYYAEQVWAPTSELIMDWDESFHDLMLHDQIRMHAYRKAIFETVRPGDHVIDLGVGSGILSQWALEAGAGQVTGIEMSSHMLSVALERLREAGLADRFVPVNALSFDYAPAEKADVLLSEIIGNLGDNENFQPILADAMHRLLKPGGRAIPTRVVSYLTPVAATTAHQAVLDGRICRLSESYRFDELRPRLPDQSLFNLYYDCIIPDRALLAPAQVLCEFGDQWDQPPEYRKTFDFDVSKSGTLTGFKGCFVAQLSPQTVLDISSGNIRGGQTSDSWKHAYLPIEQPIDVLADDRVRLVFERRYPRSGTSSFHQSYVWSGMVLRGDQELARFHQSTWNV